MRKLGYGEEATDLYVLDPHHARWERSAKGGRRPNRRWDPSLVGYSHVDLAASRKAAGSWTGWLRCSACRG